MLATLTPIPAVANHNFVLQSQDQLTRDQQVTQVAMSPDGNSYLLVWQHETNTAGTATEVHFQRFAINGTPLFAEQKLAASASRSDDQDARVSIADNGTFVLAWEATVGAGGQQNVFMQKFAADGSPLTSALAVSSSGGTNSNPDVLHYPDALEAIVVWQHSGSPSASTSSIRYMHYDFDTPIGGGVSPRPEIHVSRLWETAGVSKNESPRVVGPTNFPGGIITFAWTGFDTPTHSDIYLCRYDSLDADEFEAKLIPQFSGYPRLSESRSNPSMSIDATGKLYVVFSETVTIPGQPLDHDLYLARLSLDTGVPPNHVTPIDVDGASGLGSARRNVLKSSISTTAAGESAVVWQIENSRQGSPTSGSTHLETRLLGIDGSPISPIVSPIDFSNIQSTGPGKQLNPQVTVSPDGKHVITAWTSDVNRRTNDPADISARPPGDQDVVLQAFSTSDVAPPPPPPPPPPAGGNAVQRLDARVIASTYQLALGRLADDPGLAYWRGQLNGLSREQVVLELFRSAEFRSVAINDIYMRVLGRAADDAGRAYWVSQLQTGLSLQQVTAAIFASPEYMLTVRNSVVGYIDALYRTILNRTPDAAGRAYWVTRLTSNFDRATGQARPGADRGSVALELFMSEEATMAQVNDLYTNLLQRAADPVGLAYWSARLRSGASFDEVMAAILGSGEFWSQLRSYFTQVSQTTNTNSDAQGFLQSSGRNNWNWLRSLL